MRVGSTDSITALLSEGVPVVSPSTQCQRDVKERQLLDGHLMTLSGQTVTGRWFKSSMLRSRNNGHDRSTVLVFTKSVKVSKDCICTVTDVLWLCGFLYQSNIRLYLCVRYAGVMVWMQMKYIWRPYAIQLSVTVSYISSFVQSKEFSPVLC
jgi:hypothetical protein